MPTKIRRTFRTPLHTQCLAKLRTIAEGMRNNPSFPEPFKSSNVPSCDEFEAAIGRYQAAYNEAVNGDRVKIALRNTIQTEMCNMAEQLARYVEVEAGEDHAALLSTGFDLVKARSAAAAKPPLTSPVNFKVVNLDLRGGRSRHRVPYVGSGKL